MKNIISFKFNQIGIIHNLTLDAISRLSSFPNTSTEEAYYMGVKVQDRTFGFKCNDLDYPEYSELEPYYGLVKNDGTNKSYLNIINKLLKDDKISKNLADVVNFHYEKLMKVESEEDLNKEVESFIKYFKENKELTNSELIICWGTASTTLFSYNYWKDVEKNPESVWYELYHQNDAGKLKKFWKILGVIAADCAGILVGGAVGSVFGPEGAVAGAGVAGAAASKAANG